MNGFATYALREQLIIIGEMIKDNSDNLTAVLQLEAMYTAISFCMTSIEKVESRILQAQIDNGHLKIDIQQLKEEIKELRKKNEELLERIEI
jgi:predicted RNase H-like nuclease (RuvC/YqgF family)